MITSHSGDYTRSSEFLALVAKSKEMELKHEAACAAFTEADAVHTAKLAEIVSRLEFHHASLTAIEQRRFKTRLLKFLHGLRTRITR